MKQKWVTHGIVVLALAVFAMQFSTCASFRCPKKYAVTSSLYSQIGHNTFSQFLFFITKDVVLTRVERSVTIDEKATVVTTTIIRNVIHLPASTSGRVQGNPTAERLEIGFESLEDGSIPTLTFVKKKNDGLYYFEVDAFGHIEYGGMYYTVTYKGDDEPYLLYQSRVQERIQERNMGGLR